MRRIPVKHNCVGCRRQHENRGYNPRPLTTTLSAFPRPAHFLTDAASVTSLPAVQISDRRAELIASVFAHVRSVTGVGRDRLTMHASLAVV